MTVPHEVQLPLYYLHFEIAQLNRLIQDKFDIPLNFELKKGQGLVKLSENPQENFILRPVLKLDLWNMKGSKLQFDTVPDLETR